MNFQKIKISIKGTKHLKADSNEEIKVQERINKIKDIKLVPHENGKTIQGFAIVKTLKTQIFTFNVFKSITYFRIYKQEDGSFEKEISIPLICNTMEIVEDLSLDSKIEKKIVNEIYIVTKCKQGISTFIIFISNKSKGNEITGLYTSTKNRTINEIKAIAVNGSISFGLFMDDNRLFISRNPDKDKNLKGEYMKVINFEKLNDENQPAHFPFERNYLIYTHGK